MAAAAAAAAATTSDEEDHKRRRLRVSFDSADDDAAPVTSPMGLSLNVDDDEEDEDKIAMVSSFNNLASWHNSGSLRKDSSRFKSFRVTEGGILKLSDGYEIDACGLRRRTSACKCVS